MEANDCIGSAEFVDEGLRCILLVFGWSSWAVFMIPYFTMFLCTKCTVVTSSLPAILINIWVVIGAVPPLSMHHSTECPPRSRKRFEILYQAPSMLLHIPATRTHWIQN